jgi:hypothetical protein
MNQIELETLNVSVILPIFDNFNLKSRGSNGNFTNVQNFQVEYGSNIESLCFSKPLISFTINSLKK